MADLTARFSRIRAATEQQLIAFLETEIHATLAFLHAAQAHHLTGSTEAVQRSLANAERGYATADHFLSDPKHHLNDATRTSIRTELNKVRERISRVRAQLAA